MAVCYISEYASLGYVGNTPTQLIQAPGGSPLAEQHLAVGVNVQSAAINANTKFVRIVSDTACNLAFGANPTAVTTAHFLPANAVVFYALDSGSKIAVIANA